MTPIFNNWDVIAAGWYIACPSRSLMAAGEPRSERIWHHPVVLQREVDGQVRVAPRDFPYAVEEKYGFVWVYPDGQPPHPVPEFEDLQGKPIACWHEIPAPLRCHPHVYMLNAVDVQHLDTIHKLPPMTPEVRQLSPRMIDFTLRGTFPKGSFKQWLVGDRYEYTIRYVDGCMGLLTNSKNARWMPTLHTLFAPRWANGQTCIQPIYIAEQRPGFGGHVSTGLALAISRYVYLHVLLVDRELRLLNRMRFQPGVLLAIDAPVVRLIQFINQLQPSAWSKVIT